MTLTSIFSKWEKKDMGWIRYVSIGRISSPVQVRVSMNNGLSWQRKELLAGQSFAIPPKCTNVLMDNIPYDPNANYEIRDGMVTKK